MKSRQLSSSSVRGSATAPPVSSAWLAAPRAERSAGSSIVMAFSPITRRLRRQVHPDILGLQEGMQPLDPAQPALAALLEAAERTVGLHRLARAVDVDHAGIEPGGHVMGAAQVAGMDIGAEPV